MTQHSKVELTSIRIGGMISANTYSAWCAECSMSNGLDYVNKKDAQAAAKAHDAIFHADADSYSFEGDHSAGMSARPKKPTDAQIRAYLAQIRQAQA